MFIQNNITSFLRKTPAFRASDSGNGLAAKKLNTMQRDEVHFSGDIPPHNESPILVKIFDSVIKEIQEMKKDPAKQNVSGYKEINKKLNVLAIPTIWGMKEEIRSEKIKTAMDAIAYEDIEGANEAKAELDSYKEYWGLE